MQITYKEALYTTVGQHVASHNAPVTREKIVHDFAHVDHKKILKALQNACTRNLIHTVSPGVYRGGPKPSGTGKVRVTVMCDESVIHLDTEQIVKTALINRPPLECAWGAHHSTAHGGAKYARAKTP